MKTHIMLIALFIPLISFGMDKANELLIKRMIIVDTTRSKMPWQYPHHQLYAHLKTGDCVSYLIMLEGPAKGIGSCTFHKKVDATFERCTPASQDWHDLLKKIYENEHKIEHALKVETVALPAALTDESAPNH